MSDTVFGYSAEALTAVGTAILALETLALAGAAIWQLSALIEQLRLAREADAKADRRLIETTRCGFASATTAIRSSPRPRRASGQPPRRR